MKEIAAVILAAGASTRFGECKQLVDWDGTPLLAHVADEALAAGLEPVIVVLGCSAEPAHEALGARPAQTALQVVTNWRWQEGLSTSVQSGLSALPPTTDAALFLHCDQPLITANLLRTLVARFEETAAPIVYPTWAGKQRTPVLFARRLFSELAATTGDEGGRRLIGRYTNDAATIEVADPDVLADVDTRADYEHLAPRFQGPKPKLQAISHLIVDMDGVLWRGDEPMPGLKAFFAFLHQHCIRFVLATNNSSKTPEQYAAKVARFGIEVPVECVVTSALVTAAYLADVAPPHSRVYAIGEKGLRQALEKKGFVLTDEKAAYVVVGWDRQLTWHKLATAALLIHAGAKFIGTNPDVNYPTEEGPAPGNGAQLAALEATTGVPPLVTGKPDQRMYEEALLRMDASPETTAMIGDRLDTDIAGAVRAGLTTVLLLSGIATETELAASPVKPDLVCADIRELTQVWADQLPQDPIRGSHDRESS